MNNKKLTPGQAIRRHCLECVGSAAEVKICCGDQLLDGTTCPLFNYRLGRGRPSAKIIARECRKCMGGSRKMASHCGDSNCYLNPFCSGANPNYQPSKKQPRKRQFNGQFCAEKGRTIPGYGGSSLKRKRPLPDAKNNINQ